MQNRWNNCNKFKIAKNKSFFFGVLSSPGETAKDKNAFKIYYLKTAKFVGHSFVR